jgi:hypothetical protein
VHTLVERRNVTLVDRVPNELDPRIPRAYIRRNVSTAIRRRVVNNDHIDIYTGLTQRRSDGSR